MVHRDGLGVYELYGVKEMPANFYIDKLGVVS